MTHRTDPTRCGMSRNAAWVGPLFSPDVIHRAAAVRGTRAAPAAGVAFWRRRRQFSRAPLNGGVDTERQSTGGYCVLIQINVAVISRTLRVCREVERSNGRWSDHHISHHNPLCPGECIEGHIPLADLTLTQCFANDPRIPGDALERWQAYEANKPKYLPVIA